MSYWNDDYFEVAMKAAFEAAGTMKCPSCGSRSCGYTPQTKIFDCASCGHKWSDDIKAQAMRPLHEKPTMEVDYSVW